MVVTLGQMWASVPDRRPAGWQFASCRGVPLSPVMAPGYKGHLARDEACKVVLTLIRSGTPTTGACPKRLAVWGESPPLRLVGLIRSRAGRWRDLERDQGLGGCEGRAGAM